MTGKKKKFLSLVFSMLACVIPRIVWKTLREKHASFLFSSHAPFKDGLAVLSEILKCH